MELPPEIWVTIAKSGDNMVRCKLAQLSWYFYELIRPLHKPSIQQHLLPIFIMHNRMADDLDMIEVPEYRMEETYTYLTQIYSGSSIKYSNNNECNDANNVFTYVSNDKNYRRMLCYDIAGYYRIDIITPDDTFALNVDALFWFEMYDYFMTRTTIDREKTYYVMVFDLSRYASLRHYAITYPSHTNILSSIDILLSMHRGDIHWIPERKELHYLIPLN
jgi:hypothetical protein